MSNPVAAPSAAPSAPSSTPSTSSSSPSTASSTPAPKTSSAPPPPSSSPSAAPNNNAPVIDPNQPGATENKTTEQIKEEIRKHKLKVNGREMEFDEPEVLRRAQLSTAADEKFREAAEMRKSAEQFFQTLLEDPKSVLLHPELRDKIKFRELAEEYLGTELKREMMDPVQRELDELRQFKQQQEQLKQQAHQEQMTRSQREEFQRLQQRAAENYDNEITSALQASNLSKTPAALKRVVSMMETALSKGYEIDAATAVDLVRDEYRTDVQSMVSGLDGDSLVKFLGDDIIKKLRKFDLARIKTQLEGTQSAPTPPQPTVTPRTSEPANRTFRPDEWIEHLNKKAGI